MAQEIVIPMEGLPDPLPVNFPFKAVNVGASTIYIGVELVTPPAGWANYSELQCGTLAAGTDNYFLFDTPTRTKPATDTVETVTLRVNFYSDAYITLINQDVIAFQLTYIDFDGGGYNLVEEDGFEIDTDGWTVTNEVGHGSFVRSTSKSRTGVASGQFTMYQSADIAYLTKSFAIGAVTKAYIRVWMQFYSTATAEFVLEFITDSGDVVKKRLIPIATDKSPQGGSEIFDQWLVIASELPVNGTYGVRLRVVCGDCGGYYDTGIYYDSIKVIEKP
jgi:hypothetical protein